MNRLRTLILPNALVIVAAFYLLPSLMAQTRYEDYTFTSFVGPQESPGWYDGVGSAARFNYPYGVAVDTNGNVYAADTSNHTIRKIAPSGAVTTLAGLAGSSGSTNGTGGAARFFNPFGVAVDNTGNVYVADTYNHLIRKITPAGVVTNFAGLAAVPGTNNGTGTAAQFNKPFALAVGTNGNVYVADTYNHTVRMITPDGVVTTLAGSPTLSGTNNGVGSAARFSYPAGVTVDKSNNVYVADTSNHTIRKITPAGTVSTLAGLATVSGTNNGTGTAAKFYSPYSVSADTNGNVYVADTYNHTLRKVTPAGVVTALAGAPGSTGTTDGTNTTARFDYPTGVAADRIGNVFVADYSNNLIRKATTTGVVTTYAGRAGGLGAVDATGSAARFNYPSGVAVDASTNTYVADLANHTIRKITAAGVVSTLAGLATVSGTNNGSGSAARFNTPTGVAVDTSGNVFVADTYNHTIRKITPAGVVTNFAGMATVVERGEPAFDTLLPTLRSALAHRIRAIVTIDVTTALPVTSPAYDEGKTEAELRRTWTTRFRLLQPFKRFEE